MTVPSVLFFSLGLPLLALALPVFVKADNRLDWLLSALLCVGISIYLYIASPVWSWIGFGWRNLLPVVALAVILWSARHLRVYDVMPSAKPARLVATSFRGAMVALIAGSLVVLVMASGAPTGSVDLSFPLRDGRYVVLQGGGSGMLNSHRTVPAQAWAVDVLALNDRGRRAKGLRPKAMEAYEIYGAAIVAPCDGIVSEISDGAPDTPVGGGNLYRPAGNHVLMSCASGGDWITLLLAHLQPGSVAVAGGDRVRRGAFLGRVGNSGNSTEPHLHIHAVRGREDDLGAALVTSEAVALTFQGRFLTRNAIVASPDPA